MVQGIERPPKQWAKRIIRGMKDLLKSSAKVVVKEEKRLREIYSQAHACKHDVAIKELSTMDIEVLNANKQGIRLSALRQAGFHNMAQLIGVSASQLMRIRGIGEVTAPLITKRVGDIYQGTLESANIRFSIEQTTKHQEALLKTLHSYRHEIHTANEVRSLLQYKDAIHDAINKSRVVYFPLAWVLASDRKRYNSIQSLRYLEELQEGPFGRNLKALLSQKAKGSRGSRREIYQDFQEKSTDYYGLLEYLGLSHPKGPMGGLSKDLAANIEAFPLSTNYLKARLRNYQTFGVKYILHQKRVLLGDEMGLGKTIQALAAMTHLKTLGASHFLVVCPASVLINWERETHKHTYLSAIVLHGDDVMLRLQNWKQKGGVAITNYESLLKLRSHLGQVRISLLVVDEAHYVKNPLAQRTQALDVFAKSSDAVLFMTGTPLENKADEMRSLISHLRPDIAANLGHLIVSQHTQQFKKEVAPVYLRRHREDVIGELPDLIEKENWLTPSYLEQVAYREAVHSGNFMAMRRVSWDVPLFNSVKAKRLVELCQEASEEGRNILVFSFFRATLDKVCELMGRRVHGLVTGDVSSQKRQDIIDSFDRAQAGSVLVAQVQAGGVGLNIQAASVVIFCEPQIKPSLEHQAISRTYRMGQVRNVLVHRLLCVDTVDERMMEMLQVKQREFDGYADESLMGSENVKAMEESKWIKAVIEEEQRRVG